MATNDEMLPVDGGGFAPNYFWMAMHIFFPLFVFFDLWEFCHTVMAEGTQSPSATLLAYNEKVKRFGIASLVIAVVLWLTYGVAFGLTAAA